MSGSFQRAMELIDAANSADPHRDDGPGGPIPKELLYSQRMTAALFALRPDAGPALQLAARAQHLERWRIARSAYAKGRAGYHRWRADLGRMHAKRAGELLREALFDEEFVERVQKIIRKQGLRTDDEARTLEDTACLVFLEHYLADFARGQEEAKVIDILRKTWAKMSEQGRSAALALPLGEREAELVSHALQRN